MRHFWFFFALVMGVYAVYCAAFLDIAGTILSVVAMVCGLLLWISEL